MNVGPDVLRATHLSGGIFLDAEFTAPWCVMAQVGPEDCRPFASVPRGIIAYHYVSEGQLWLKTSTCPSVVVSAGSIVVLPRNDPHVLGSAAAGRPVNVDKLIQPTGDGKPARIVYGGGGAITRILCGFLGVDTPEDPVIRRLPDVMTLNVPESAAGVWIESSLRFAASELAAGRVRSMGMLSRLTEMLFIEAVERYWRTLPGAHTGLVGGLRDTFVSRALACLHDHPERHWTTQELARQVGLSRSALARRFSDSVGDPPMRYLARMRMQIAARRLRESLVPISRIALEAGYESEASFTKAFKRAFGAPPATWRRAHQALTE